MNKSYILKLSILISVTLMTSIFANADEMCLKLFKDGQIEPGVEIAGQRPATTPAAGARGAWITGARVNEALRSEFDKIREETQGKLEYAKKYRIFDVDPLERIIKKGIVKYNVTTQVKDGAENAPGVNWRSITLTVVHPDSSVSVIVGRWSHSDLAPYWVVLVSNNNVISKYHTYRNWFDKPENFDHPAPELLNAFSGEDGQILQAKIAAENVLRRETGLPERGSKYPIYDMTDATGRKNLVSDLRKINELNELRLFDFGTKTNQFVDLLIGLSTQSRNFIYTPLKVAKMILQVVARRGLTSVEVVRKNSEGSDRNERTGWNMVIYKLTFADGSRAVLTGTISNGYHFWDYIEPKGTDLLVATFQNNFNDVKVLDDYKLKRSNEVRDFLSGRP